MFMAIPKTVNHHLSSLKSLNSYLIKEGEQEEMVILDTDFMKIQTSYASPCTIEKKDKETLDYLGVKVMGLNDTFRFH